MCGQGFKNLEILLFAFLKYGLGFLPSTRKIPQQSRPLPLTGNHVTAVPLRPFNRVVATNYQVPESVTIILFYRR